MKFFLDTANIEEIKKGVDWGIIDGVTTNPTLIAREGTVFEKRVKEICEIVKGPVSAEVVSLDYSSMIEEARELAMLDENVVVKIPMTFDGIKAVKTLSNKNQRNTCFQCHASISCSKSRCNLCKPFHRKDG
ncbi:MAG: transaldolase [Thermotogaceae bacterium]|jgi:transaldolase|nr:transaldolase [Thermotogaceae bacterium]MDN5337288.1 transaldolase [Thermotogaceae bacterium]